MATSIYTVVNKIFFLICVISTIFLTSYCLYQYIRDDDFSLISFKKYHRDKDNIYPAVSLCFSDFLNHTLFENISSKEEYKDFLRGYIREDRELTMIDYKDAVIEIDPFILEIFQGSYTQQNNAYSQKYYRPRIGKDQWTPNFYPSLTIPDWKCWTFEVSYYKDEIVTYFSVILKSDIFRDSTRKELGNFMIMMSYPDQLVGSRVQKYSWRPVNYHTYTMYFEIQNVIIFKQRKKQGSPCNQDWRNSDKLIAKNLVETLGCRPVYFDISTNLTECKNYTQYANLTQKLTEVIQEPCRKVEKVLYSYDEYRGMGMSELNGASYGVHENTSMFKIVMEFQGETFMEIEQTRSYDVQNLVGNAGGYVGLFLGAALMQLPAGMGKLGRWLKAIANEPSTKHANSPLVPDNPV